MKYLKPIALVVLILCAAVLMYVIITYETKVEYVVSGETIISCKTNAKHPVIPASIDNKAVTSIGNRAFCDNSSMITVKLDEGIKELQDEAFYNCSALREAFISKSVTYISPTAFSQCPEFAKVEVEQGNKVYKSFNGVLFKDGMSEIVYFPVSFMRTEYYIAHGTRIIGEKAFYKSPLYTVYIPDTVTYIQNYAFAESTDMKSITLPANLIYLGENVFLGNGKLRTIKIGANVEIQPNSVDVISFYEQYQRYGEGTYLNTGNNIWEYIHNKD